MQKIELKYDTGFSMQHRIISLLLLEGSALVPPQLTGFWTLHSGRAFMPSGCAALQFPRDQRNYLGGWSAEGSDRYARTAMLRTRSLEGSVVKSIEAGPEGDTFGEQETLTHLLQYGGRKKSSTGLHDRALEEPLDLAAPSRTQARSFFGG